MVTLSKLRQYDEALQKVRAIRILELACGERHTAAVLESGNVFVWGCVPRLRNLPRRLVLATRHSPLTTHHSPLATHHSPLATHHSPLATHQVERQGPARHAARWAAGLARDAHAKHAQGSLGAALHSAERPLLWPVLHLRLVVRHSRDALVRAQSRLKGRGSGLGAHFRCRAAPLAPASVGYPNLEKSLEFPYYYIAPPRKTVTCNACNKTVFSRGHLTTALVTRRLLQLLLCAK